MVLFTAAEFKEYAGIPSGNTTHDALIGSLATRITTLFNSYTRRKIEAATYTEEHDGTGTSRIVVKNPPINSVTTLKKDDDRNFASATPVTATDFVFDASGVITLRGDESIFPAGVRTVQVVYAGGFTTVPEDIKQAALLMCGSWFNRRRAGGLASISLSGISMSFQQSLLPKEVMLLLNRYRLYPVLAGNA